MPNFDLSHQPRFELVHYDTDTPITEETLTQLLNGRTGITLCIRSAAGHENRGGPFLLHRRTSRRKHLFGNNRRRSGRVFFCCRYGIIH